MNKIKLIRELNEKKLIEGFKNKYISIEALKRDSENKSFTDLEDWNTTEIFQNKTKMNR
ncbi:MAG: hypothetical protein FWH54_00075 [Methanobrevibacter sp.]|nr:hypothetical protein [Methanobrevibacter sp.]